MHQFQKLARVSRVLNAICICLGFQFCFPPLALGNHCSAHVLLKCKSNRPAWYCPTVLSSLLELQVEPSDLGAVVCNAFSPIKTKVRDFAEDVTPKKRRW